MHLAILREPFLQFILDGKKTIESRFYKNRCAPYNQINEGDVILLKKTSGPVVGLCKVTKAWFYEMDSLSWKEIKDRYGIPLCAQSKDFWQERKHALFATLMKIDDIKRL